MLPTDLRIGRFDFWVTAGAPAAVKFTWPEGFEAASWSAVLGATPIEPSKNGLDVTVSFTAQQTAALSGPTFWTLLRDGTPVIRGEVTPHPSGSAHGSTSIETTVLVESAEIAVTVLGGGGALADLTDVNVAGVQEGQLLRYSSGMWVPFTRPPQPGAIRFRTGRYAFLAPKAAATFVASAGFCALVPFDMDEPGTLESISVDVTSAGHSDSVIRLGVYADDGSYAWGDALVVDAGTVSGVGTGVKTADQFDPVELDVGRYWAALSLQGTLSPAPQLRGSAAGPYAGQNLGDLSFTNTIEYTTGVSGALPSTIGAASGRLGCPQIALAGSPS